jgi:hypothetical protein
MGEAAERGIDVGLLNFVGIEVTRDLLGGLGIAARNVSLLSDYT